MEYAERSLCMLLKKKKGINSGQEPGSSKLCMPFSESQSEVMIQRFLQDSSASVTLHLRI